MNNQVNQLFQEQLERWPLASNNFNALSNVRTKDEKVRGINYRVQFNPSRIVSSGAKVDKKSIKERKCFLCKENRPPEQKGIFYSDYIILINPFPIFPKHLTISKCTHQDQLIYGKISDLLDLSYQIDKYVLFYNGPKSGASAPDHMHFQAGNKGFLPIQTEIETIARELICVFESAKLFLLDDQPRNSLLIKGKSIADIDQLFNKVYNVLPINGSDLEPMLNLLSWYENNEWHLIILLRKKHRPSCYFAKGEDKLLSSPASVDLGGVFITPIESDFNKINSEKIEAIIDEVSFSKSEVCNILKEL